jgi:hypothetical protein
MRVNRQFAPNVMLDARVNRRLSAAFNARS